MIRDIMNRFFTTFKDTKVDLNSNNVCYELDFFGKPGTTASIEFDSNNKCFRKFDYDAFGNRMPVGLPVSLKKKNELAAIFYQDVLEYLKANESKWSTYQSTRLKKKVDLKALYMDILVSGIVSVISLVLTIISFQLATVIWPILLSLLICIVSVTYFGVKLFEKHEYDQDEKKLQFLEHYKLLQMSLNDYNLGKTTKHIPTKYQGLVSEPSKGNNLRKTKLKKQDHKQKLFQNLESI